MSSTEPTSRDTGDARIAAALLVVAVLAAYANSLSGPFLFDDQSAIVRNPTIREFSAALSPPVTGAAGVVGRPVVNLSLALNYALGGLEPSGYHAFNLIVHALATLVLFGFVRRTAGLPRGSTELLGDRTTAGGTQIAAGTAVAFAIALLWALHPLQTESVTFVIRRTESLASLFYLLTLYAFVRAAAAPAPARRCWQAVAVGACLVGVATKEIVATAPLLALVFDRTFIAGTFRGAWQARRGLYLALGATWIPLAWLVAGSARRGGAVGVDLDVGSWEYLLTQCRALVLYLKLSLWPDPLVVDHGAPVVRRIGDVWSQAVILIALGFALLWAARRRAAIGFAAAWFLIILAPSSSLVPLTPHTIAEHRMYLPLAAIVAVLVVSAHRLARARGLIVVLVVAAVFGWRTARRNADYANAIRLWTQTLAHVPDNPRAHFNLANALAAAHRAADAVRHYEAALELEPAYGAAHTNLAAALLHLKREPEAIAHYEAALRLEPNSADIHANLAAALIRAGRMADAVVHYERAAKLGMLAGEENLRFGRALAEIGRLDDALLRLNEALRLNPNDADVHVVSGMVLAAAGRAPEALRRFTTAVTLAPNDAGARCALGDALVEAGRPSDAVSHYEAALGLQPGHGAIHTSLANALIRIGRAVPAISHYEEALRINPDDTEARTNLEIVRAAAQRRGLIKK